MRSRGGLPVLIALALLAAGCSDTGGGDDDSGLAGAGTTVPSSAVSVTSDVAYAGDTWKLDIYAPEDGGGLPVVVLLHGFKASKASHVHDSDSIAGHGAVVYAINAPVSGLWSMTFDNGKSYREMSEVLSCAIGYAEATAGDFGGDPDRVVFVAHSFGALYGAWFALGSDSIAARWDEYAANQGGPPTQATCEADPSTRLAGFIGVGGGRYAEVEQGEFPDEYPDLREVVNPYSYLGHNLALPIRLLHGESDLVASPESSRDFNEILLDAGHDSQLILFDGGHIVPPELTYETVARLASR